MNQFGLLSLLFAIVCQAIANNSLQTSLNKLETLSQKIKSEAKLVEDSLAPSLKKFDAAIKDGFHAGQKGVADVYSRALEHLDTVPEECVQDVKSNLLQLQADADKTFLSCSNLTMAVRDLGNLVTYTGNMFLGLARSLQELTWFTNCFSWNPMKSLPCFFDWIGLIYQGTKGLISSLGNFNSELDSTLLNMLKIIEYCQARTVQQNDVVSLMTPVHECAKQPIPHHLYTVQNHPIRH